MNFGLGCLVQCVGGKGHCSGHCDTDGKGTIVDVEVTAEGDDVSSPSRPRETRKKETQ